MPMTAEQTIKQCIIESAVNNGDFCCGEITADNIDESWDEFVATDIHWDYVSEFREGDVETGVNAPYDRNYESKSVATQIGNQWVGWTYWYGGGKHGQPEAIDWMEDAYFLDCVEEEKVVKVKTFTKRDAKAT